MLEKNTRVCPTLKEIFTGYRFASKMKFFERCAALLFLTVLNISLWLTMPLYLKYSDTGYTAPITGLGDQPWKVRSLQGVSEKHRASFEKFYNDDRRFFGSGKDKAIDLTPKIKPHDFLLWDDEEQGKNFKKGNIRNIVTKMFRKSDLLRKVDNVKRLLIAAEQIQKQVNVSSLTFKSVLQIKTGVMGIVKDIEDYGRTLQLTRSEKRFLMSVVPHKRKEEETNKANKESSKSFVWQLKEDTEVWPQELWDQAKQTGWYSFYTQVTTYELYKEGPALNKVLKELATQQVTKFTLPVGLVRLRPTLDLAGGAIAHFSPVMSSRTQETIPNHLPRDDVNRHTAEIAAFHLDRVLGFRRASPVVGRTFNITRDLMAYAPKAYQTLNVFTSLEGNKCFYATACKKCHFEERSFTCGRPDMIEGSMLLSMDVLEVTSIPYPWARSQILNEKNAWEKDVHFCMQLRMTAPYYEGRRLLDFVDLAVMDFLQGNQARTECQVFEKFEEETFILHNQNAHGFGQAYHDEITILAPLYQCCLIRYSTFQTLLGFELGPHRLSELMADSLLRDPLAPILLDQHLLALDRRVSIVLKLVYECIKTSSSNRVVIDDGL